MRATLHAVVIGLLVATAQGTCNRNRGQRTCAVGVEYDYVIVGAGPAGTILAAELSKDARNRVLLIEEGGFSSFHPDIDEAAKWFGLTTDPLIEKGYKTVPQKHMDNRVISLPRARTTGGCGSHNGMVYILGNEKDFNERWNVTGWKWDDLKQYWDHIESTYKTGMLDASDFYMAQFIAAAEYYNYSSTNDPNDFELNRGKNFVHARKFGSEKISDTYVKRESAWTAYMEPILDGSRKNLDVIVNTRVNKVLFRGQLAIGVETFNRGTRRVQDFHAKKEVILAAGAYDTPKLLQLSGVGDCDMLMAEHGIACTSNVPGVGQNLQDHTFNTLWSPPLKDQAQELPSQVFGMYGAIAHEASGEYYHGFTVDNNWVDFSQKCIGVLVEPFHYKSRGTVKLADTNPASAPVIDHNYLGTPEDEAKFVATIKKGRELMYAPNLRPLFEDETQEVSPGWSVQSDADILAWGRARATSDFHPASGCKMANDFTEDPMAVVDKDLRVKGTQNLRVVDGSIMPHLISGNPNQVTMIIGFKGADIIQSQNCRK
eukprot:TRINITY_DN59353_c0_g1_i1.p1 TRINITY_DN59353_c0_g1~~TRINITY_DN59353_c0_g1_i1.p1  ORF type:complete len:543 (+),score=194.82 TRINITY_DN59353_c0_g1_i1:59-1687(+)